MAGQILNHEVFAADWTDSIGVSLYPDRAENYRDGAFLPWIRDEWDLERSRGIAKWVSMVNSTGICALDNLTNYTVGNGYDHEVVSKKKEEASKLLLDECNEVLEEFVERDKWLGKERRTLRDSREDGESFVIVQHIGGGMAKTKVYMSCYLTEPIDRAWASSEIGVPDAEWKFGIATDYGDATEIHGYCFDRFGNHEDDEVYTREDVTHIKLNTPDAVKRGLSDFYCCHEFLKQKAKILENTAEGTALQAAIAWVEENAAGVTKTQAETTSAERLDRGIWSAKQRAAFTAGLSTTDRARKLNKGSIVTIGNGKQYKPGPLAGAQGARESAVVIAEAVGRFLGSRWQMPEFMINNNSDVANYSSIFVSESPFMMATRVRQQSHAESIHHVFWRVLELAIQGGRISSVQTLTELKRLVRIKSEPPNVETRNRREETTRNKILTDNGIIAPSTWAAREDVDHDEEIEAGAMHSRERFPQPVMQQPFGQNRGNAGGQADPTSPPKETAQEGIYP